MSDTLGWSGLIIVLCLQYSLIWSWAFTKDHYFGSWIRVCVTQFGFNPENVTANGFGRSDKVHIVISYCCNHNVIESKTKQFLKPLYLIYTFIILYFLRFEQAEEALYTKLESAENRITELEEKLKEALDNEKTMRYQLEDVEYSEVILT